MLIKFTVSNFLSFNKKQTFSMEAGKARKNVNRIYRNRNTRILKFRAVYGGNAAGKSNLIEALDFMKQMVVHRLPTNFAAKYFRQDPQNRMIPSTFEVEGIIDGEHYVYGFSILLSRATIQSEYFYKIQGNGIIRNIFNRDLKKGTFEVGGLINEKFALRRLNTYGYDSLDNYEYLLINLMNRGMNRHGRKSDQLNVISKIYSWFVNCLTINKPNIPLAEYPFYSNSTLNDITKILNYLDLGISNVKVMTISEEKVLNHVPRSAFTRIVSQLERQKARHPDANAGIVLRSYKQFYTFELSDEDELIIKTIEFSHENPNVYFDLDEESDGTARILDLVEIFLKLAKNKVYVIDEIDRGLHPKMTKGIIKLFLEMATERNTQLIVTTHADKLLEEDLFRSDEVCFVEKNSRGESTFTSLESYNLRSDKNVYTALYEGDLKKINQDPDILSIFDYLDSINDDENQ